jgi:endonuclease YncB( thermonuclease family)
MKAPVVSARQAFAGLLAAIALTLFAVAALAQTEAATDNFLWGKVVGVEDGDTIAIKDDQGKTSRIQMAYIDAPDYDYSAKKAQPLQGDSRKKLEQLVLGKDVIVESFGVDQFDRVVGMVFLDKLNVNVEMVRTGMAEIYQPIRLNPGRHKKYYVEQLVEAEKLAKEKKEGIWGEPDYISPFLFRRRQ